MLRGLRETKVEDIFDEGLHDEYSITALMMTVDPKLVRMPQRLAYRLGHHFVFEVIELLPGRRAARADRVAAAPRSPRA